MVLDRVWETEISPPKVRFYTRIKIFDTRAHDAAKVEILLPRGTRLTKLTGRTIHPDGKVFPLKSSDVYEVRHFVGRGKVLLKGKAFTMPAVVDGAIIEYGYEYKGARNTYFTRSTNYLQDTIPIERLSYAVKLDRRDSYASRLYCWKSFEVEGPKEEKGLFSKWVRWQVEKVPALKIEPFMPPMEAILPSIDVRLGRLSSWASIRRHMQRLLAPIHWKDRTFRRAAEGIIGNAATPAEKIDRIYRYLQEEGEAIFREVLASRGFDDVGAEEIMRFGMNLFFVSLLAEVGITADPVLVADQRRPALVETFPSANQFDGMISAVFRDGAYTFYDPSSSCPAGVLPWEVQGGKGMILGVDRRKGERGGTPIFPFPIAAPAENLLERRTFLRIGEDGSASAEIVEKHAGQHACNILDALSDLSPERRRRWMEERIRSRHPLARLTKFSADTEGRRIPKITYTASLGPYLERGGARRLLLPLFPLSYPQKNPFLSEERQTPVFFPFLDARGEKEIILIPPDFEVERFPDPIHFENEMGKLLLECRPGRRQITCRRLFVLKTRTIPPARYREVKAFFEAVARANRIRIILRKGGGNPAIGRGTENSIGSSSGGGHGGNG